MAEMRPGPAPGRRRREMRHLNHLNASENQLFNIVAITARQQPGTASKRLRMITAAMLET
jgi:hypothetical protein